MQVWIMPFPFPFYGHILDRIAVSTGGKREERERRERDKEYTNVYSFTCIHYSFKGFLYTGTFYHSQIHLTQFIAPLQANFNPSLNDTAKILVYSSGNHDCMGVCVYFFLVKVPV